MDTRLGLLLVALVSVAAAWARLPWSTKKVVWGEDGTTFLVELQQYGFLGSLFKSYTGYLQFWPRVLAAVASQGDLRSFAIQVSFVSCLAVGLLALGVFCWSSEIVRSVPVRLVLAFTTVLFPVAPIEVLGNLANLHWYLIWAGVWLMLYRPTTDRGAVLLGLLAATFALTEIQLVAVLPLALVNLRWRRALWIRVGLLLGSLAQVVATLSAPRVGIPDRLGFPSLVLGYFVNGPFAALAGDLSLAGWSLERFGPVVSVLAYLPFCCALVLVLVLVRGRRQARAAAITLFVLSPVTWFAAAWVNLSTSTAGTFDYADFGPAQWGMVTLTRYSAMPSLALLGVAVLAVDSLLEVGSGRGAAEVPTGRRGALRRRIGSAEASRALAAAVLVVIVCLQMAFFTPVQTYRTGEKEWALGVDAARVSCKQPGREEVQVAEAPRSWTATVRCSSLVADSASR